MPPLLSNCKTNSDREATRAPGAWGGVTIVIHDATSVVGGVAPKNTNVNKFLLAWAPSRAAVYPHCGCSVVHLWLSCGLATLYHRLQLDLAGVMHFSKSHQNSCIQFEVEGHMWPMGCRLSTPAIDGL